jgi:hypothetical protein
MGAKPRNCHTGLGNLQSEKFAAGAQLRLLCTELSCPGYKKFCGPLDHSWSLPGDGESGNQVIVLQRRLSRTSG